MHLIDLYDEPPLHLGFEDRMHPDAYGYRQLADYLATSTAYGGFMASVREFYAALPGNPASVPMTRSPGTGL
jgi:hypothetical protein